MPSAGPAGREHPTRARRCDSRRDASAASCAQQSVRRAGSCAQQEEVTGVTPTLRSVRLHSRPHIDLQRVSAALCCS
ncbi:putative leader peptide [Streptomyces lincolnensis]|uniref:putative leader peptide n=1 Tax=Streptomyces lincolnensis TaxID=1915 RepID=UPI003407C1EA